MTPRGICIIGATGSIGINTLAVIAKHPEHFKVFALSAHQNIALLRQQCHQFQPQYVVVTADDKAEKLRSQLESDQINTQVLSGAQSLDEIVIDPEVDMVMAAIVGAAGLLPIMAAAKAGKTILLANKEALVCAGDILLQEVRNHNARLLPIDSEHNAIFQCLPQHLQEQCSRGLVTDNWIKKIILTASGGPLLAYPLAELRQVTPEIACSHPNWDMGKKISVDSATMMNKGLEYIEACWLFHLNSQAVEIVIHPQSAVHSMVEFTDNSLLAHLGPSDMKTAISYSMGWPQRIEVYTTPFDILKASPLEFMPPDLERFPCLKLALNCQQQGTGACIVLNAANEMAVQAFLQKRIYFTDIYPVIAKTIDTISLVEPNDLETVINRDKQSRLVAEKHIKAQG